LPAATHGRFVTSPSADSGEQPAKRNEVNMTEKNSQIENETRHALPETNWEDLVEPGAYVEKTTGDLYRVPREALIKGASPIIMRESQAPARLVQVSKNPFVTALEARHRCAQHNIQANF
jgi:hypothetical protein